MPEALFWYMMPSAVLSLIGTSFIIFSFFMFKTYRQKSSNHSVICCIAVSDWMFTMAFWVPIALSLSDFFCFVQAFLVELFAVAGWLWPSIFAIRLLLSNIYDMEPTLLWAVLSHLFGWGIPLTMAIYSGAAGMYGRAGLWCYIDNDHPSAQIFLGDGLVVIVFAIELFVFSLLMRSMYRSGSGFSQIQTDRRVVTLRMSLFLLIPPVCWTWALADRLLGLSGHSVYWLQVVHAIMGTSQGFLNAVLYGWDPELMSLWASLKKKKHPHIETARLLKPEQLGTNENFIDVNSLYIEHDRF